jgi:hypothetical protein
MRQVIKLAVLQRIKEDEVLIFEIAQFLGKKFRTVYQWVLDNSDLLQAPAVLQMIKERFQITDDSEILEETENGVAA